jgi:hypothetical protein
MQFLCCGVTNYTNWADVDLPTALNANNSTGSGGVGFATHKSVPDSCCQETVFRPGCGVNVLDDVMEWRQRQLYVHSQVRGFCSLDIPRRISCYFYSPRSAVCLLSSFRGSQPSCVHAVWSLSRSFICVYLQESRSNCQRTCRVVRRALCSGLQSTIVTDILHWLSLYTNHTVLPVA